jgi:transposase
MERLVLTDAQWAKMEPHCLGKASDPGRSGGNNRLFIEAILWIVRTGSPWRDLPEHFGKWNTVFVRYRDWVKADVFKRLFDAVSEEPDMEYAMVDATIVKVHRHGQGAKDPMMRVGRRPEGDQSRFATNHSERICHVSRTNLTACRHPG